eukprot:2781710-Pyramimonas_sp.AAC.1
MAHLHYAAYWHIRTARTTYTSARGYTGYYMTYSGCGPTTTECARCQIQLRTSRHGKLEFCSRSRLGR